MSMNMNSKRTTIIGGSIAAVLLLGIGGCTAFNNSADDTNATKKPSASSTSTSGHTDNGSTSAAGSVDDSSKGSTDSTTPGSSFGVAGQDNAQNDKKEASAPAHQEAQGTDANANNAKPAPAADSIDVSGMNNGTYIKYEGKKNSNGSFTYTPTSKVTVRDGKSTSTPVKGTDGLKPITTKPSKGNGNSGNSGHYVNTGNTGNAGNKGNTGETTPPKPILVPYFDAEAFQAAHDDWEREVNAAVADQTDAKEFLVAAKAAASVTQERVNSLQKSYESAKKNYDTLVARYNALGSRTPAEIKAEIEQARIDLNKAAAELDKAKEAVNTADNKVAAAQSHLSQTTDNLVKARNARASMKDAKTWVSSLSEEDRLTVISDLVMERINSYREANGLHKLVSEGTLNESAVEWSKEMSKRQSLDHSAASDYGENILKTSRCNTADPVACADYMFNMWKNSDGHNENMLHEMYSHQAVGIVKDAQGHYWATTQFFSKYTRYTDGTFLKSSDLDPKYGYDNTKAYVADGKYSELFGADESVSKVKDTREKTDYSTIVNGKAGVDQTAGVPEGTDVDVTIPKDIASAKEIASADAKVKSAQADQSAANKEVANAKTEKSAAESSVKKANDKISEKETLIKSDEIELKNAENVEAAKAELKPQIDEAKADTAAKKEKVDEAKKADAQADADAAAAQKKKDAADKKVSDTKAKEPTKKDYTTMVTPEKKAKLDAADKAKSEEKAAKEKAAKEKAEAEAAEKAKAESEAESNEKADEGTADEAPSEGTDNGSDEEVVAEPTEGE